MLGGQSSSFFPFAPKATLYLAFQGLGSGCGLTKDHGQSWFMTDRSLSIDAPQELKVLMDAAIAEEERKIAVLEFVDVISPSLCLNIQKWTLVIAACLTWAKRRERKGRKYDYTNPERDIRPSTFCFQCFRPYHVGRRTQKCYSCWNRSLRKLCRIKGWRESWTRSPTSATQGMTFCFSPVALSSGGALLFAAASYSFKSNASSKSQSKTSILPCFIC